MPAPRVGHDHVELWPLRDPSQVSTDTRCGRVENRGVARSARCRPARDRQTGRPFHRRDHVFHRRRPLGAGIVGTRGSSRLQPSECAQVRVCQITHVNVVAQARAIRCWVILAEDVDGRPSASGLDRARDHVNLGSVILAELAFGIRTGGVEVAQPDRPDAVRPLEVRKGMLDRELGLSVRSSLARSDGSR